MRTHLVELKPFFDEFVALPMLDADKALAQELRLAAALKPMLPNPGTLTLELIEIAGKWKPLSKNVADALSWNEPVAADTVAGYISTIASIRNHLGAVIVVAPHGPHEDLAAALKANGLDKNVLLKKVE